MKSTRISIDQAIATVTYPDVPSGGAIHLPGLPNNPFPIPGITEFLSAQRLVLQPQYFGTYDSAGEFDPEASDGTLLHWLRASGLVLQDLASPAADPVQLPSAWDVLSGHSFGTYPLLKTLLRSDAAPRAALFFAPTFAFGQEAVRAGITMDFAAHAEFIRTAFPRTFRPPGQDTILRFLTSDAPIIPTYSTSASRIPCVFVFGGEDPMIQADDGAKYANDFCSQYPERLQVVDVVTVPGAGHDVAGLLTEETKSRLRAVLAGD